MSIRRLFSTTTKKLGGHGPFYEPSGNLFNRAVIIDIFRILKPGEPKVREYWEAPMYIGFVGATLLFAYAYHFKPDRKPTEWARIEAERRLEAHGETFGWPFPPGYRRDPQASKVYPREEAP